LEMSIETDSGHRWTCNVAYRRVLLERVGAFQQHVFRFAHAEDRDLALRMLTHGPIGYDQRMEIVHTPRAVTLRDVFRQARWTHDDLVLYALHPQLTDDFTLPAPLALVWGSGIRWMHAARNSNGCITPRRGVRALAFSLVGLLTAGFTVIQTSSAKELRRRYSEFLPQSQPRSDRL
jgi:GT2 family glycosyltransferase